MTDTILVAVIVAVAAVYIVRRYIGKKSSGCGCCRDGGPCGRRVEHCGTRDEK